MLTLRQIDLQILSPALRLLPPRMDSVGARVMLLTITQQEDHAQRRVQLVDPKRPAVKGPARGLWQFELGTKASRGGVWGVYLHAASRYWLQHVCEQLGVEFAPRAIWLGLEGSDVLAAAVARLLLFTDAQALPAIGNVQGAWSLYRARTWRPGKPKPETWPGNYARAVQTVGAPSFAGVASKVTSTEQLQ